MAGSGGGKIVSSNSHIGSSAKGFSTGHMTGSGVPSIANLHHSGVSHSALAGGLHSENCIGPACSARNGFRQGNQF